jgi:nucleoside-diphosphate-sugar epimerase
MSTCIIFGGSGFVGTHLARHFLSTGRFDHIHIADIRPTPLRDLPGISYSQTDVRQPVFVGQSIQKPEWIFNLAAIHREPGHEPREYYATNLPGAKNVCDFADRIKCDNMYFTSSISVYGPTTGPTDEDAPIRPVTAYGSSKHPAEVIHQLWRDAQPGRRLLISRPGVLYGPGDPGNIMRMIKAIKRGYFAYPGSPKIMKSYGYIHGLIASIDFLIDAGHSEVVYNYAESPTEPLGLLVAHIKHHLGCKARVVPVPLKVLLPLSKAVQVLFGDSNPIHPVRVTKAATPTHIVPQRLLDLGFDFKYSFLDSLRHWRSVAPEDFGLPISEASVEPVGSARVIDEASPEDQKDLDTVGENVRV